MSKLQKLGALLILGIMIAVGLLSSCSNKEAKPHIKEHEALFEIHFNDGTVLVDNIKYEYLWYYKTYGISYLELLYHDNTVYYSNIKYYDKHNPIDSIETGIFTLDYYIAVIKPDIEKHLRE